MYINRQEENRALKTGPPDRSYILFLILPKQFALYGPLTNTNPMGSNLETLREVLKDKKTVNFAKFLGTLFLKEHL